MSFKTSTNARNNVNNKLNAKPFCKVCFDAKRNDYNTHFLKDFSGPEPVVLCPYLLALKCNYCKEEGHTVSYCEVLKAKNGGESTQQQQKQSSKHSQNGNFFILRVSKDKETVSHSSRKTVETVSEKKKLSTTNQFALLKDDEEEADDWEMPKYNKTRKPISFDTEEVVALVAAEPEPIMMGAVAVDAAASALPTWAKIAAMPPARKKAATPVLSTTEVLKKGVASLFVSPASYEKPTPKFIHTPSPSLTPSTDIKPETTNTKTIEKYFFAAPTTTRGWDDDSSSQDDGW